jgi:hypothetical protein
VVVPFEQAGPASRWRPCVYEGRKRVLPYQPDNARPTLRPKLLSISTEGKLLEETDLLVMGTGEPLIIFDLGSGATVDPAARAQTRRSDWEAKFLH